MVGLCLLPVHAYENAKSFVPLLLQVQGVDLQRYSDIIVVKVNWWS